MSPVDDTQPRSPFADHPEKLPPPEVDVPPIEGVARRNNGNGAGCAVSLLVAGLGLVCAVLTVFGASYAGWDSGLQVARGLATQDRFGEFSDQCDWIGNNLLTPNPNLIIIERRIEFLQTEAPDMDCLVRYIPTATAAFFENLPTPTATSTIPPTPTATMIPPTPEPTTNLPTATATSLYDLNALMAEAQSHIDLREWEEAVELYDAILAIDPTFQKSLVEQRLFNALASQARIYYRSTDTLAEAIVLTNRAEEYGDIDDLNYERYIAGLYLDAMRYVDLDPPRAIRPLSEIIYTQGLRNYQGGVALTMLFEQYVKYGDAFGFGGEYCRAVDQYNNALNLQQSQSVVQKRDTATQQCANGTTTTTTDTTGQTGEVQPTIAPVGVGN